MLKSFGLLTMTMTIQLQRRFLGLSSTPFSHRYFIIALIAGYGVFIYCLGLRRVVLISGGVVLAAAAAYERYQRPAPSRPMPPIESANYHLLDQAVFYRYVASRMPPSVKVSRNSSHQSQWQQVSTEVKTIQTLAANIAQQEPTLIPDLIDTLYTVVDLGAQFALALQAVHQVQMPAYKAIAQQRLKLSQTRLQQTHRQMRSLHDQLLIEGLSQFGEASAISTRLQALITDNKSGLLKE